MKVLEKKETTFKEICDMLELEENYKKLLTIK